MSLLLVGIDLAVAATNSAIAIARFSSGRLTVDHVSMAVVDEDLEGVLDDADIGQTTLLCIDAPLGWPQSFRSVFADHRAASPIDVDANTLFRRETDRDIYRRRQKTPLDVGADRIARTALRAVNLVGALRRRTQRPIDLPLTSAQIRAPGIHVLETYPAGYIKARNIEAKGYRDRQAVSLRLSLLRNVVDDARSFVELSEIDDSVAGRADLLDSVLCVLAGYRAWTGVAPEPTDRGSAEIEGWIWCE